VYLSSLRWHSSSRPVNHPLRVRDTFSSCTAIAMKTDTPAEAGRGFLHGNLSRRGVCDSQCSSSSQRFALVSLGLCMLLKGSTQPLGCRHMLIGHSRRNGAGRYESISLQRSKAPSLDGLTFSYGRDGGTATSISRLLRDS
jgi:hypothetical protein